MKLQFALASVLLLILFQASQIQCQWYVEPRQLLLGDTQTITATSCTAYYLEAHMQKLVIDIIHQENVEAILLSTRELGIPCTGLTFHQGCLDTGASYCSFHNLTNLPADMTFHQEIATCDKYVYLYIQPNESATPASLTIHTSLKCYLAFVSLISNSSLASLDHPCKPYANLTQYEECGATNMSTCRNTCTMTCVWVSCMINVTTPTNRTKVPTESFGACLPKNLSSDEYEKRCYGVMDSAFWVVRTDNCSGVVPPAPPESSNAWIWITIVILILIFAGVVAYYRYSLQRNLVPPFHVPGWCPECLFPRVDSYTRLE